MNESKANRNHELKGIKRDIKQSSKIGGMRHDVIPVNTGSSDPGSEGRTFPRCQPRTRATLLRRLTPLRLETFVLVSTAVQLLIQSRRL